MKKTDKIPDIDSLMEDVYTKTTKCKCALIKDSKALEFIARVIQDKREGKEPNIARAAELLLKHWDINVKRRALSAHIRGECSCQIK